MPTMNPPSGADVQGWSEQDALTTATVARAQRMADIANAMLRKITGIDFATVAPEDEAIVQQAVTGLAEMITVQSSPDYLETLSDFDLIQSFNAGNYSETRRSAEDARKARLIVAWPWLNDILWNLLTPDKYDYWVSFFGPINAPAFAVTEMDWSSGTEVWGSYDDAYLWGA